MEMSECRTPLWCGQQTVRLVCSFIHVIYSDLSDSFILVGRVRVQGNFTSYKPTYTTRFGGW
jgi:hypothetical protein